MGDPSATRMKPEPERRPQAATVKPNNSHNNHKFYKPPHKRRTLARQDATRKNGSRAIQHCQTRTVCCSA